MSFNSVNNNNLLPEEFSLNNSQENTNSGNPQKHLSLAITNRVLNLINTCESSERDIFLTKLVDLKNHIEKCPEDESQLKILNLYQKVILSYPSEIKKIILSTETQTFCSQYLTIDNEENFLKELYVIHPELFKLFVKSCFENEDSNGALVKSLKKAFPEAPEFFYQSISEYFETNSYRLTAELFFIYMALSSFSAKQVFVENLYAIESQSEPFSSLRNFLFSKLVIKYIQQNSESLTPRDLSLNLLNLSLKLNKESNFFLNFMVKATGDYENLKTRYIFATIIFIENLLEKTNKQHVFLLTEFLNKLYDAPDLNSVMNVLKSSLASINFLENHSDILKKNPYLGRFFPDFKESQFADFAKLENEEQVKHIRSEKSLERKFVLFSIYVRDGLKGKDLLNSKKFIYQSQYLLNNISNFIKYQIFNSEINAVQTLLSICSLQAYLNKPEYEDYLKTLMNSFHELILDFNNAEKTADAIQDLRNNLLSLAIQERIKNPKYSIGSVFPEYFRTVSNIF